LRRAAAFTLVEVLLSFTLTSIMLVLVMNIFPTAMVSVHRAEHRQHAGGLADSVLERKANLGFHRLAVGSTEELPVSELDGVHYHTVFSVEAVPGRNKDFLRMLRVVVKWKYRGRDMEVTRELWVHRLASERL
jgi:type II secretory pathway pseudopilin PulG